MPARKLSSDESQALFSGRPVQGPTAGNLQVGVIPPEMGSVPDEQISQYIPEQQGEVYVPGANVPNPQPEMLDLPRSVKVRKVEESEEPGVHAALRNEPTAQPGWYTEPQSVARSILDGMTFGWSDELGAGVAAAAAMMDGADYGSTYNDMLKLLQQERNKFDQEHPTASLLTNIAGGIASPANVLAPAALTKLGAFGKLATQAPKTAALAKGVTTGIAEGAVAGAGSAQQGNRAEGAAFGAALGAAVPVAFSGLRGLTGWMYNNRIAQQLGSGEDFVPLHMADRGNKVLQRMMRRGLGNTFGGGGKLREQSEKYIHRLQLAANRVSEKLEKAKRNAKDAIEAAKRSSKNRRQAATQSARIAIAEAKQRNGIRSGAIKLASAQEEMAIQSQKVAQADAFTEQALGDWRQHMVASALPPEATAKVAADIMEAPNMNAATAALARAWDTYGFNVVKKRHFRVSPSKIREALLARIEDDSLLLPAQRAQLETMADGIVEHLQRRTTRNTKVKGHPLVIAGDVLNDLRATLHKEANKLGVSDNTAVQAHMFRELAGVLDDVVEKQLKGKAKETFKANRKAWATNKVFRESVDYASADPGSRGAFGPKHWLQAVKAEQGGNARRKGIGSMQEEANAVQEIVDQNDKLLTDHAEQAIQDVKIRLLQQEQAEKEALERQIRGITHELKATSRAANVSANTAKRRLGQQAKIETLQKELDDTNARINELERLSPTDAMQNGVTALIATTVLGTTAGAPLTAALAPIMGPVAPIAAGTAVSSGMASEAFQRMLAGQTKWQTGLDKTIEKYFTGSRVTERAATRGNIMVGNGE